MFQTQQRKKIMELILKRKHSSSDKDPLIVVIETDLGKKAYKINIGETLELDDEDGYQVLGKFKGLFEIKQEEKTLYKTKIAKPEL